MLIPGLDSLGNYVDPTLGTSLAPEDQFRQFSLDKGQPVGPVTLDGPSSGSGYFNSFRWTSGTNISDPFVNTRPGAIQIDGVSLTVESVYDILTKDRNGDGIPDSFNVKTGLNESTGFVEVPGGPSIKAEFHPMGDDGPVSIRDLAQAVGVDFFTWVNRVTEEVPGSRAVTNDGQFALRKTPRIDPETDSKGTLIQSAATGVSAVIKPDVVADALPYYWNLDELNGSPDRNKAFVDTPALPEQIYTDSNSRKHFETQLVGVRLDQPDKPIDLGVAFDWSSNTGTVGGAINSGGIDFEGFERTSEPLPSDIQVVSGGASGIGFVYGPSPPVARDDLAYFGLGSSVSIPVLANDFHLDFATFDPTSVNITMPPAHGTVALDPTTGNVLYSPAAGFTGSDTFRYTVKDEHGAISNEANVTAQFELAPQARDDAASARQAQPTKIDVLANDSDADGALDPRSVTIVRSPSHGSASVYPASGRVLYTPTSGYTGPDDFTYTVADNLGVFADQATVRVNVIPQPPSPKLVAVTLLGQPAANQAQIAVDFSVAMDPASAQAAANYTVAREGNPGLNVVSTSYAEVQGLHRATLIVQDAGPMPGGEYAIRLNGRSLRSAEGIPMATASDNALVVVDDINAVVSVGLQEDDSIGPGQISTLGYSPPASFVARDFDGDGIVDVVTASAGNARGGQMLFLRGLGGGRFADPVVYAIDPNYSAGKVVAADWNGDGHLDVVLAATRTYVDDRIYIFLNDGHGKFSLRAEYSLLREPSRLRKRLDGSRRCSACVAGP